MFGDKLYVKFFIEGVAGSFFSCLIVTYIVFYFVSTIMDSRNTSRNAEMLATFYWLVPS